MRARTMARQVLRCFKPLSWHHFSEMRLAGAGSDSGRSEEDPALTWEALPDLAHFGIPAFRYPFWLLTSL